MAIINKGNKGFTLVELIVVIIVIGILAGIVIVSYGAWRKTTTQNVVQSDLKHAASAMESERNFSSGYPLTLPSSFSGSKDVNLSYAAGSAVSYCINATSTSDPSIQFYISSSVTDPQLGQCPQGPGAAPNITLALVSSSQVKVSWSTVAYATTYNLRYATSVAGLNGATITSGLTGTSQTVSGLSIGVTYYFQVQGQNTAGQSPWSSPQNITTSYIVNATVFAGSSTAGFVNGTGTAARFYYLKAITKDGAGNLYVSDGDNAAIRKITPAGVVTTLAGSPATYGYVNATGAAAGFATPNGLVADSAGNIYVADGNNDAIRKITPAGVVTTLAGPTSYAYGYVDGTGTAARFWYPQSLGIDATGTLYTYESGNYRIRKITSAGVVTTLAGSGGWGYVDGTGTAAQFSPAFGNSIAVDSANNIYIADSNNYRIRKITPAGVVTTLAGSSTSGHIDGTGTGAQFKYPSAITFDDSGNLLVGDRDYIRKVTLSGVVSTVMKLSDYTIRNSDFEMVLGQPGVLYILYLSDSQIYKVTYQ